MVDSTWGPGVEEKRKGRGSESGKGTARGRRFLEGAVGESLIE